jgi:hypothetical protein
VLRAFSGIDAVQSQMLGSNVLAGLPANIFDAALLWQPAVQLTRRRGFPSWSWAGWHGGVRWMGDTVEGLYHDRPPENPLKMLNTWLQERTWIIWYHLDDRQQIQPVFNNRQQNGIRKMFWPTFGTQQTPNVGYRGDTNPSNIYGRSNLFKDPTSLLRDRGNQQATLQLLAGELKNTKEEITPLLFKTLLVTFRIQASTAYLRYGSVDPVWDPNGRVIFLLLNKNNAISGYVLLDESWRAQDLSTQDFLLLSEANYHCEYGRPHENHSYTRSYNDPAYVEYHVMMVKWRTLDVGTRVAERAGIGRVLREAVGGGYYDRGLEVRDVVLV